MWLLLWNDGVSDKLPSALSPRAVALPLVTAPLCSIHSGCAVGCCGAMVAVIAKVALALDLGLSLSASEMKRSILVTSALSLTNCHSAARHATGRVSVASFSMIRIRELQYLELRENDLEICLQLFLVRGCWNDL
ncbi:TPA: hypothetical protein ACXNP2_003738 [Stenotrophomonas maltophilia]